MSIRVEATHGIAIGRDEGRENYYGWPSVAKLDDGTLVAGGSGPRAGHICPWGKSSIAFSKDGGETWSDPVVVHNDMIDNRDLGVVALGGQKFAVTWFSLDVRVYDLINWLGAENNQAALDYMATWNQDTVDSLTGSWMKITEDGGKTWSRAIRVPVTAPHGFSVLKDGSYGYLGNRFCENKAKPVKGIFYASSRDGGCTWQIVGEVPIQGDPEKYNEPHVIELDDGTLLGVIRYEDYKCVPRITDTLITRSADGGKTWSEPKAMYVGGYPPHLLKHSSGAIVMVYGYRHPGCGQRAVVSYDNGMTWSPEMVLRDDGEHGDLGYPCSVELDDGSIYTVYYQAKKGQHNTAVMWTRWKLPELY